MMRFLVQIDSTWLATITAPVLPGWCHTRQLRKQTAPIDGRAFPLPPLAEMPDSTEQEHLIFGKDASERHAMYRRIINRTPNPNDIEAFGRSLFLALIGDKIWDEIVALAHSRLPDPDPVGPRYFELALGWQSTEGDLFRLNWEMMRAPSQFLAAGGFGPRGDLRVGITRFVAKGGGIAHPVSLPPRILFVINSDLADAKIRPGAEIMGLLDRLEGAGRAVHQRVLCKANAKLILREIHNFRPDVVHFICHGAIDGMGNGYLLVKDDKQEKDVPAYADQIHAWLATSSSPPVIVVLSACQVGAAGNGMLLGSHETAPLAVQLVERGVPIVIGMAGRVSDQACRWFTLAFGCSLLSGHPLLSSITIGRSEAFAKGPPVLKSPDWAFPAVFLSRNVDPAYTAAPISSDDASIQLASWLMKLKLTRKPIFSARQEFFEACDTLLGESDNAAASDTTPGVLGIFVKDREVGYGRTRLLLELAGQAVTQGHLPLIHTYSDEGANIPHSYIDLAAQLIDTAGDVCSVLKIPPIKQSQVRLLKRYEAQFGELRPELAAEPLREGIDNSTSLTPRLVRAALQLDLLQLLANFRNSYSKRARILVLLNRIELFDHELAKTLLYDWAEPTGLGSADQKIPLILSFACGTEAKDLFTQWKAEVLSKPWILTRELKPFGEGEDMLAFARVFRNPFCDLVPGISDVPLVFNEDASPELIGTFEDLLRERGKGMPRAFLDAEIHAIAKIAVKRKCFIPVRDKELLEELFHRQRK